MLIKYWIGPQPGIIDDLFSLVDFIVGGVIKGLNDIVGFLGEALERIVKIVQTVLTELANRLNTIATNIKDIIRTPIIDALQKITDTFVFFI